MLPGLLFGKVKETSELGALSRRAGRHKKTVGVPDAPVEVKKRLPTGSLIAKAADADPFSPRQSLHLLVLVALCGVRLSTRRPNGKEDRFFPGTKLLAPEVPQIEAPPRVIGAGRCLTDGDFVINRDAFGRLIKQ